MSQIQCPFCNHANTGAIPFCSECGRVLPMGDEAQVMAETIGSSFELKWALVGMVVIFVLSSITIFGFRFLGMDLSFMRAPEPARLDAPGLIGLSPDWVLAPVDEPVQVGIRTLGVEALTAPHAVTVKVCGQVVPVIRTAAGPLKAETLMPFGVPMKRLRIPAEDNIYFAPPQCSREGFYDVEVRFENGTTLRKQRGLFYTEVTRPWFLFYTETGLDVLEKILSNAQASPEQLVYAFKNNFRTPTEDAVKTISSILQEEEKMKMLSIGFWGLFLLEALSFFLGGMIASRLSPGITIKESMTAGVLVVFLLIARNMLFFGATGMSYLVFQLLIMFPTYASMAAFGGYMGEKWQGLLQKKPV
ncbi:MAG: hypothetical protein CVU65_17195 [Deltaproteobacteria bacterium HGW-Deltaproteobacteria-22]|jgi:hypothetical protein|nr:MAG: hypothetical protein CVU65_17195 [Deltaproteobacteria bacterium HGW-Deltaproteobacteria-22]